MAGKSLIAELNFCKTLLASIDWFLSLVSQNLTDMRDPKVSAEIAKQLGRFYEMEVPGSKQPQLWIEVSKFFDKGLYLRNSMHKYSQLCIIV